MSEWFDSQKQSNSNIRQLLQERIKTTNPRRELTAEEAKRLAKLETKKIKFYKCTSKFLPIFGCKFFQTYL